MLVKFRLKKAVEPAIVCVLVLSNQTVPPFASKVPLVLVKFPAKVMVPEGAVKAPEERVKLPSKFTVVYAPRSSVVALVVNREVSPIEKPLNPERAAVLLNLTQSLPPQPGVPPVIVKVPVPESVPLRVKPEEQMESEESTVGLLPKGKEQALPTVTPEVPLLSIVTRLKVILLQERVVVVDPLKATVPPLALKTGEPETVKLPVTFIVPEVALKVPEVKEKEVKVRF